MYIYDYQIESNNDNNDNNDNKIDGICIRFEGRQITDFKSGTENTLIYYNTCIDNNNNNSALYQHFLSDVNNNDKFNSDIREFQTYYPSPIWVRKLWKKGKHMIKAIVPFKLGIYVCVYIYI